MTVEADETASWIIELGADDPDGHRECFAEISAGTLERDNVLALAGSFDGVLVSDVLSRPGVESWPVTVSGDSYIAGASVVFYDGDETQQETYAHIEFNRRG